MQHRRDGGRWATYAGDDEQEIGAGLIDARKVVADAGEGDLSVAVVIAFPRGRAAEDGVGGEGGDGDKDKASAGGEVADLSGSISCARDVDVLPGVYEGGLKAWECCYDLLDYICEEHHKAKRDFSSREVACWM